MKVKKYTAPTMPEAMNNIRKELGPDAVILNSKEVKHGGILGFFQKKRIEVVAALDPDPVPSLLEKDNIVSEETTSTSNSTESVLQEMKHMKKMIALQFHGPHSHYDPDYQIVYQHLLEQEVDQKHAKAIIDSVVKQLEAEQGQVNMDQILQAINKEIKARLSGLPDRGAENHKKIVHIVGPTGVGKTTTLAKIAANSMLKDHKRVAFITADTYRIAAIEQLKTYARILDVPLEVVYTNEDYRNAIDKFTTYDLILVDTAGRNFRDEKYVKILKESLDVNQDHDTYLALSLTAKPKDLTEIYDQFYSIPLKGVIFTKIDETRQFGSIFNIALNNQIDIAYLSNGQDVPDDLVDASPAIISDLIVGAYDDE